MYYSRGTQTLVIRIDNWNDALVLNKNLDRWLFRGQKDADWILKTTVERAFEFRNIDIRHIPVFELMSLNDFRKIAHNFSSNLPEYDDMFAWLAIMQHYSGPTRLLDFTESFYIAAYFALIDSQDSCAIWAINRPELMERIRTTFEKVLVSFGYKKPNDPLPNQFLNLIMQKAIAGDINEKFIFTASPKQLNERQYIQQGLSVIPSNLSNGFMDSLLNSFGQNCFMPDEKEFHEIKHEDAIIDLNKTKVLKVILDESCFLDARRDLNKMSINSLTLFRGLDGLGKHQYDILNSFEHYEKNLKN